jgi:transposase-like protein
VNDDRGASLMCGASLTEVARQHGIGTGQLYNRRRALLAAQPATGAPVLRFVRVDVTTAAGPMPRAVQALMSAV